MSCKIHRVRIKEKQYRELEVFAKNNYSNVSKVLNDIIDIWFSDRYQMSKIESLLSMSDNMKKNIYIIKKLLEQLYSDLSLQPSYTKNSRGLIQFYKCINNNDYEK